MVIERDESCRGLVWLLLRDGLRYEELSSHQPKANVFVLPVQAFREAQWHQLHQPTRSHVVPGEDGFNQARRNWQRAVSVARRAGGDDRVSDVSHSTGTRSDCNTEMKAGATAKMMDLQYFLEMVDLKHRHGSNLRWYHSYWRNSSSNENFFFWLDIGDGRDVQIPQCPREKLEREQVRYLTRDERMNYLVTVDESGLFRWAKNNEPVWTNTARFKDSLQGIVDIEDDVPQFSGNSTTFSLESTSGVSSSSSSLSSSSTQSLDSALSKQDQKPFTDEEYKAAKMMKKVVHANPAAAVKRHLGRSPKRENMWLFVR